MYELWWEYALSILSQDRVFEPVHLSLIFDPPSREYLSRGNLLRGTGALCVLYVACSEICRVEIYMTVKSASTSDVKCGVAQLINIVIRAPWFVWMTSPHSMRQCKAGSPFRIIIHYSKYSQISALLSVFWYENLFRRRILRQCLHYSAEHFLSKLKQLSYVIISYSYNDTCSVLKNAIILIKFIENLLSQRKMFGVLIRIFWPMTLIFADSCKI